MAGITLLRPPSEVDAAIVGLPGMRALDVSMDGFDPLYRLKHAARIQQISRRSSAPNMRAMMNSSVGGGGCGDSNSSHRRDLPRTMSSDRAMVRRQSSNKIVVHAEPQIARSGSSKDDPELVENLLKQSQQLSRFSLF